MGKFTLLVVKVMCHGPAYLTNLVSVLPFPVVTLGGRFKCKSIALLPGLSAILLQCSGQGRRRRGGTIPGSLQSYKAALHHTSETTIPVPKW